MLPTKSYAAFSSKDPLAPFEFSRRDPGPHDVAISISHCGVCHSDIHQVRDEWGGAMYPMVPGHEIVGTVFKVGNKVSKFKAGDLVGVGCFVDSCRKCKNCTDGEEQYCDKHVAFTYNGTEMDEKTPTYGGYSNQIVVDENYVLKVPSNLNLAGVAPLLCAGITTYSPLRTWEIGSKHRIAVMGLGGLGHMGVKFGVAFGAHVTVLSTSESKRADAKKLGAQGFALVRQPSDLDPLANSFDFILDTVSAPHDVDRTMNLLRRDGTLVLVGVPPEKIEVAPFSLIPKRRRLAGSMIGGIRETQEMLDFCGKHTITSDVEVIPMTAINTAYDRMVKGDVKYRFVIDIGTL